MGFKVPNHSGVLYLAFSQPLCFEIWKEQIFKVQPGSPWSCQDPRHPLHMQGFVLVSVSHPEHLWQNPVQRSPVPSLCYSPGKFLPLGFVVGIKWFFEAFCAPEAPTSAHSAENWMKKVDFWSQLTRGRWCKVQKSLSCALVTNSGQYDSKNAVGDFRKDCLCCQVGSWVGYSLNNPTENNNNKTFPHGFDSFICISCLMLLIQMAPIKMFWVSSEFPIKHLLMSRSHQCSAYCCKSLQKGFFSPKNQLRATQVVSRLIWEIPDFILKSFVVLFTLQFLGNFWK